MDIFQKSNSWVDTVNNLLQKILVQNSPITVPRILVYPFEMQLNHKYHDKTQVTIHVLKLIKYIVT